MTDSPVTHSDTIVFSERGYTFRRLLGEGSYAKVWLVEYNVITEDGGKDCNLACKIIDNKKAPRDFINRFLPREMDILAKITHPYLIHLHSIYQRKSKFFIFMRFAEKGDLLDHVLANGEVNEKQAKFWTRQLSLGLQYLHNLEIVHRDIKCENVLITANNNVKLGDFGFARFMIDSTKRRLLSSTYCGSLAYAAPELLRGRPYDPKHSDVWSLGVVLFVMLNQCMPFSDKDMNRLYEMQINSQWNFRNRIIQIVSEDAKSIVQSMLTPDAKKRIMIDDVVNHRWFSSDERFKAMSTKEREALEVGLSIKTEIIPKSTRVSIPTYKKHKKNDLVCVTTMRTERSSNQFQFRISDTMQRHSSQRDKVDRRTESKQQEKSKTDEQGKNSKDSEVTQNLKVKSTTSSDALLQTVTDGLSETPGPSQIRSSKTTTQPTDKLSIIKTSSSIIPPKSGETNPNIQQTSDKLAKIKMSSTVIQQKSGETNPNTQQSDGSQKSIERVISSSSSEKS